MWVIVRIFLMALHQVVGEEIWVTILLERGETVKNRILFSLFEYKLSFLLYIFYNFFSIFRDYRLDPSRYRYPATSRAQDSHPTILRRKILYRVTSGTDSMSWTDPFMYRKLSVHHPKSTPSRINW